MGLYPCSLDVVIYIVCIRTKNCNTLPDPKYCGFARILVLRLEELPRKNTTPSASLVRNHVMFVFVKGLMRKKEEKSKKKKCISCYITQSVVDFTFFVYPDPWVTWRAK